MVEIGHLMFAYFCIELDKTRFDKPFPLPWSVFFNDSINFGTCFVSPGRVRKIWMKRKKRRWERITSSVLKSSLLFFYYY